MNLRLQTKAEDSQALNLSSRVVQKLMKYWAASPLMPSSHLLNLSVSHSHRFIWFRVAKVATRSTLENLSEQGVVFEAKHPLFVRYPLNTYHSYFKFAFVRNPWDRLASCWKNKILDRHIAPAEGVVRWNDMADDKLARLERFENFVSYVEKLDVARCDPHLRSQSRLIDLNHLDFLGRFENNAEDMNRLADHLALPRRELPKRNQSENKDHYSSLYTPELIARVGKIYRRDIEIFGYSFDD